MSALSVCNFHVFRGERHVLRGVSFELDRGCCLQVTGQNGAGKTTLLRALCGLVEIEAGGVAWEGRPVGRRSPELHANLAYLGHEAPLKADLSARENLRFSAGIRRTLAAGEIDAALARVAATAFADRPVRTLSAGQRRRIALAALWLFGVPLWILDEPTTNLDTEGQGLVAGLIEERLGSGGLVVAAVHHPLAIAPERLRALVIPGSPA
jgi:heme exporter protein A